MPVRVRVSSMSDTIGTLRHGLNRVWRSRVARNVAVVASGTVGAQVITIASAPFITRIYGPEAFGLLGTFQAILFVATPASAMAYPIAVVLCKEDRDALGMVRLSIILSLSISLIAAGLMLLWGGWLTEILGAQSVASFLLLIPVGMIFSAWTQIAQQWLIRKNEFGAVARSALAQALILNTAKAGVGWFYPLGAVLIVLATLGYALQALLLFICAYRRWQPVYAKSNEHRSATRLRDLALRHRDFPLYRAPQNIINAASQSLPVLMLAAFFGPTAAGFYTLGKMVMGMPSALLGKAVTDVFYPRITEAARQKENLSQQILGATSALIAIGALPFGLVIIAGPWLFSLVFGEDWAMAGEYASWLALFYLFNFINKPCVAAVPVLGIQRGLLVYELLSTGAKVLGLIVGFYWFGSDLWAVALFSVIGVVAYAAMMLWILTHAIRWSADAKAS